MNICALLLNNPFHFIQFHISRFQASWCPTVSKEKPQIDVLISDKPFAGIVNSFNNPTDTLKNKNLLHFDLSYKPKINPKNISPFDLKLSTQFLVVLKRQQINRNQRPISRWPHDHFPNISKVTTMLWE